MNGIAELYYYRQVVLSYFYIVSSEASLPPHPPTSPPHAFPTAPLLSAITVPPNKVYYTSSQV